MPRRSHWFLLYALCLAAFLPGCARPVNREAESRIRRMLPQMVGPAREWRVRVDGAPMETIKGRLHRVQIDGDDVRLGQMIGCESLHIEMTGVVVDVNRKLMKEIGSTTFRAVVNEEAVNRYVREFPPPDDEPVRVKKVRILDGRVYAEETRWLLGKAWPYTVVAEPRLSSPTKLDFAPDRMTALGLRVPLPKSALRWLAKRLSEGFDFGQLAFPVRIAKFDTQPGKFVLEGTAEVMDMLNSRTAAAQ